MDFEAVTNPGVDNSDTSGIISIHNLVWFQNHREVSRSILNATWKKKDQWPMIAMEREEEVDGFSKSGGTTSNGRNQLDLWMTMNEGGLQERE